MDIGDLKRTPLLIDVDKDILLALLKDREIYESRYKRNVTIHGQDESCDTLDFVLSGSLVAYSLSQNGSETVLFEFSDGSIIGANLLFGENCKYPLNIYCQSDCTLLHITKTAVMELLKNYGFVMRYIRSLSQNSQGMNRKIAMFTQKSLRQNILDYLTVQTVQQKSDTITLPITKKQLADYLGVQRPSLFREMKRLTDEGIIVVNNRRITVNKH